MTKPLFSHASPVSQAGFTIIPNAVMLRSDLSPTAKLVYGYLKHLAWRADGDTADPAVDVIAGDMKLSERTVRDALRALERAPAVEGGDVAEGVLVESVRRGQGRTNAYVIHDPAAPSEAPRGTRKRTSRPAKVAGQERQDLPVPAGARSLPQEERETSSANALDSRAGEWPPPVPPVFIEPGRRNVPLEALLAECGIDGRSRRVKLAAMCLNGRSAARAPDGQAEAGIRDLFWVECVRHAEEADRRAELLEMTPAGYANKLVEAIRRKAAAFREAMPDVTLGPKGLADHWMDLRRGGGQDGFARPRPMSRDEFIRRAEQGLAS